MEAVACPRECHSFATCSVMYKYGKHGYSDFDGIVTIMYMLQLFGMNYEAKV
jgi:hypothetical protein